VRGSFLYYIRPLLVTVLLLIICEVLSTTILPLIGLQTYRIPFNVLIVLYFGFKVDTPYTALMILIIQYFHSFFSIEGWEMGTIAGISICIVMSFLRDLIHFSSSIITVVVTQLFQFLWIFVMMGLLYIKHDESGYVMSKFWHFLPESFVLSLLAPFLFYLLDAIWSGREENGLGDTL